MVEKEKGMSIKCLKSDAGREYFSNEFNEYLRTWNSKEVFM
jgi:hypothetical protein